MEDESPYSKENLVLLKHQQDFDTAIEALEDRDCGFKDYNKNYPGQYTWVGMTFIGLIKVAYEIISKNSLKIITILEPSMQDIKDYHSMKYRKMNPFGQPRGKKRKGIHMKSRVTKSKRNKASLLLPSKTYQYYKSFMNNYRFAKSMSLVCYAFLKHYAFEISPEEIR